MMVKLPADQLAKGVICSSAGNHAQGVALSASKLGCTAVIVMPVTTPEIKVFSIFKLSHVLKLVSDGVLGLKTVASCREFGCNGCSFRRFV